MEIIWYNEGNSIHWYSNGVLHYCHHCTIVHLVYNGSSGDTLWYFSFDGYMYIYIIFYVYVCVYVYVSVCVWVCLCVYVSLCLCVYAYMRICIYAYMSMSI